MNDQSTKTKDEDSLIESVLQGKDGEVKRLAGQFPDGVDLARDLEEIKKGLLSINDREPPLRSDDVLKKQKLSTKLLWLSFLPTAWYMNPFILCFGLVVFLWFLYIFIVFLLR